MTDAPINTPPFEDTANAPFIYFDISPAYGILNGAVQVELASRILIPDASGPIEIRYRTSGHLRCSPTAAALLRDTLDAALKMLEQPQQGQAAAKLN